MTNVWTRHHVRAIDPDTPEIPLLEPDEIVPAVPDLYLWDLWPICREDGSVHNHDGAELWMALSAPRSVTPIERHDLARLRLLAVDANGWRDLGPVFPDGASPGSREWAGSATIHGGRLVVRYTAVGHRNGPQSFAQRIVGATAHLEGLELSQWSEHREIIPQPSPYYVSTLEQTSGAPGYIKAFRDPAVFLDIATGTETLLFAGSLADSTSEYNAAVGIATRPDRSAPWEIQPPLVHADGVNNEMERPHIVHQGGLYYLFFSTQARTFHPDLDGPTGLYGFVTEDPRGEWMPLNESGLVARNPEAEPYQCYSWLVLPDLRISAFVDMPRLGGRSPDAVEAAGEMARVFGGTPAPTLRLELDGTTARLANPGTVSSPG